jgi:hypothetical protein
MGDVNNVKKEGERESEKKKLTIDGVLLPIEQVNK